MLKNKEQRKPTIQEAIICMVLVIGTILLTLKANFVLDMAMVLGATVAALMGLYLGYGWDDIEDGMVKGVSNCIGCLIILILIGATIGTWILGGTIQTMIYYGLQLLTPSVFIPVAFLLCCLTSVLLAGSFACIATMGIVLVGVGEGLGIPRPITAGAIVAGAMFGDKVSPLSDSTNLAAAMAGTTLFEHVGSMLYVSVPSAFISLLAYTFIGRNYGVSSDVALETVQDILAALSSNFNLSPLTLIPALIVVILSVMRAPAIAALVISFFAAGSCAILTQGASFADVLGAAGMGFVSDTGHEFIDTLLTQGGIVFVMGTIVIVIAATAMGGILERIGVLQTILDALRKYIKKPRDLILATLASAYVMLIATGEMLVSIIIPARTLGPAYKEMGVHPKVHSRTLETAATLMCGALPWGVVTVYAQDVLGVGIEYIPYCLLPFIAPIVAIIYAFIGFATFPAEPEKDK